VNPLKRRFLLVATDDINPETLIITCTDGKQFFAAVDNRRDGKPDAKHLDSLLYFHAMFPGLVHSVIISVELHEAITRRLASVSE
jgi:hypothetical protein